MWKENQMLSHAHQLSWQNTCHWNLPIFAASPQITFGDKFQALYNFTHSKFSMHI